MFETLARRKPRIVDEELCRKSAVVIPLIQKENGIHILFEVRSGNLRTQPGEICFPGGSCEAGETPRQTALREIREELNIRKRQIRLIGPADVFISPFNMMIHPYIGWLEDYKDTHNGEVAQVFTVPLAFFQDGPPQVWEQKVRIEPAKDFPWDRVPGGRGYPWRQGRYPVCFYTYREPDGTVRHIWGLTAKIMENAAALLKEASVFSGGNGINEKN